MGCYGLIEHITTIRVRYGETDAQKVVYHGHHFAYFEAARTELLRARGLAYRDMEAAGQFLVVTDASCRYRGRAGYDDVLRVAARVTEVSRVRVRFAYTITLDAGGPVVAEGETTLACVDAAGRPRRLPTEVVARLRPGP